MAVKKKNDEIEGTKLLMGALVRMKPKPHEDMKAAKKVKAAAVRKTAAPARRTAG